MQDDLKFKLEEMKKLIDEQRSMQNKSVTVVEEPEVKRETKYPSYQVIDNF